MQEIFYVYITASVHNTTLYTGITNNLERRMQEHKTKVHRGFSAKFNVNKLVYYERFQDPNQAIAREKQIKGYGRNKKAGLISTMNPTWSDLTESVENVLR